MRRTGLEILLGIYFLFFSGIIAYTQSSTNPLLSESLVLAEEISEQEQWDSVASIVETTLERHKSLLDRDEKAHIRFLRLHALALQQQGQYEIAKVSLTKALDISGIIDSKSRDEILYDLGRLSLTLRQKEEAQSYYLQLGRESSDPKIQYLALNDLSMIASQEKNSEYALELLLKADSIASMLQDTSLKVEALNQLATISYSLGLTDSSRKYFEKLVEIHESTADFEKLISDLNQYAFQESERGEYEKAQRLLLKAMRKAEEIKDTLLLVGILTRIGDNFSRQKSWEQALKYAARGESLAEKWQVYQLVADNLRIKAEAYQETGRSQEAIQTYEKALKLQRNYLGDALETAKLQLALGSLLEKDANISYSDRDYAEAIERLKEVFQFRDARGEQQEMLDAKLTIGGLYIKRKMPALALEELTQAEELSRSIKSKRSLEKTFQLMANAYKLLGDYSNAFQYQELYGIYKDSLYQEDIYRINQQLSTRYEAELLEERVKQKQLELEREQAAKQVAIQRNFILVGSVVGLLLILGFIIYAYFKRQQFLNQEMLTMEKEFEAQNLRAVITGEEQERLRLARELHDGLGALLASVKVLFNASQYDFPDIKEIPTYQKADNLLDQACREVREISHNLSPSVLDHYGLGHAIEHECEIINNNHKIDVECILHGLDTPLESSLQVSIYRISQELMRNIVKHAEASEIILQITVEDEQIQMTVEDNGKGFNVDEELAKRGIGLKNIQSRVAYLKGSMEIESAPGQGCAVYIGLPLKISTKA